MHGDEIKQIVREAVIQALHEAGGCTGKGCMERCGITPVQHAESHKAIGDFLTTLAEVNSIMRGTLVKIMVGIAVVAAAIGLGFHIEKYIIK